jgi:hypothetical protein
LAGGVAVDMAPGKPGGKPCICGGAPCCGVCEGVVVAGRAAAKSLAGRLEREESMSYAPSAARMALMSGVAMVGAPFAASFNVSRQR